MQVVNITLLLRVFALALIFLGLWGAASISYNTLTGIKPCPSVFVVPICYIVLAAYAAMFVSQLKGHNKRLFYLGWAPVFLIALVGVGFEVARGDVCPKGGSGVPACYLSLGLATIIFFAVWGRVKLGKFL